MANIIFKRGLLADLPSSINDGHVYVTTDEKAMYVDINSTTRIRLTDVVMLSDSAQLTTMTEGIKNVNQIYITPDAKMYRWIKNQGGSWQLQPLNAAQTIDNIIQSYMTEAATTDATTTVTSKLTGSSVKSADIKFISEDTAQLVMSGTTTTVGSQTTGNITFTLSKVKTTAEIFAEQNGADTKLIIKNRDKGVNASGTNVDTLETTGTSVTLKAGTGVTLSTQNGVVTITSGGGVQSISNAFDANGQFVTTVTQLDTTQVASTAITPQITYGNTPTSVQFLNGTATLQVYTKSEVDAKIGEELKATNSMTFKGGLDGTAATTSTNPLKALPTTGVQVGDTYKVVKAGTYGGQLSKMGDMFIATAKANATEQADGTLAAADIEWVYIPSGDETIHTYSLIYDSGTGAIQLKSTSNDVTGSITSGNSHITLSGTGNNMVVTHALVTTAQNSGTAVTQGSKETKTIGVVTSVTTDDAGHVTAYTVQDLTVVDTHNQITSITFSAVYTAATNVLTSTVTIADSDGNQVSGNQQWDSDTLQFGVNGNVATIDLVWGSF